MGIRLFVVVTFSLHMGWVGGWVAERRDRLALASFFLFPKFKLRERGVRVESRQDFGGRPDFFFLHSDGLQVAYAKRN